MYFLLSPAKSLDEKTNIPFDLSKAYTQPELINASIDLMEILKTKEPIDIMELMSVSDNIAQLNVTRNQQWQWHDNQPFTTDNAKAAAFLFDGDVYSGLDVYNLSLDQINYLNSHLGILSGLYGLLKPLDLIQPYRLEMGTALSNKKGKNLYEFWDKQIAELINQRTSTFDDPVIINLASNEYFKSVHKKTLNSQVITPRFEDEKNGKFKVISFYAKKARGLMVKYAAINNIEDTEQIKAFDLAGYYFVAEASDNKTWTFRRNEESR